MVEMQQPSDCHPIPVDGVIPVQPGAMIHPKIFKNSVIAQRGDHVGCRIEGCKGRHVQMIVMAVGDQDMVGGRHVFDFKIQWGKPFDEGQVEKNRVDQKVLILILDHYAGVIDERDRQSRAVRHCLPVDGNRYDRFVLVIWPIGIVVQD